MKNEIIKNYNMYPDIIYKKEKYYFFIDDYKYIIEDSSKIDINYFEKLYLDIKNNDMNTLIKCKNNQSYFVRNDKKYMLFKINNIDNSDISLYDINKFSIKYDGKLVKEDILNMYYDQIDRIENQISEYNMEYPNIRNCVNYYIGIAENACFCLNYKNLSTDKYFSHKSITSKEEFYNPLNVIIASYMFDYANYFKLLIDAKENEISQLIDFVKSLKSEYKLEFFSYMMYPSIVFNKIETIIKNKENDESIKENIKGIKEYENILRTIYANIKDVNDLPIIEWLVGNK